MEHHDSHAGTADILRQADALERLMQEAADQQNHALVAELRDRYDAVLSNRPSWHHWEL